MKGDPSKKLMLLMERRNKIEVCGVAWTTWKESMEHGLARVGKNALDSGLESVGVGIVYLVQYCTGVRRYGIH